MTKSNRKGIFITFEGPEGAGKSTQLEMLREYLISKGRSCIVTREPGGTEIGEQLRDIVKHYAGDEPVSDATELLLFAASRAQHVKNLIEPALMNGTIVLCDRFSDSTLAYQGFARKMDREFIQSLNSYATGGVEPDLTLLLDIAPELGSTRTVARQEETSSKDDRIESEGIEFHRAVRAGFLKIAKMEPERVKVFKANAPIDIIHREIVECVVDAFGPL